MLGEPASLDHVDDVVRAPYEADGVLVIAGAIPPVAQRAAAEAFGDLDELLPPSLTRRAAAGAPDLERIREHFPRAVDLEPVSPTSCRVVRDDGHTLRQVVSNPVRSYIGGWRWDRFKAQPALGIVTQRYPDRWLTSRAYFEAADNAYAVAALLKRNRQIAARSCSIAHTSFTTAAINLDYASHYHLDAGDFPGGFSTVGAIAVGGDYEGGELVFPTLRLAVDLRPGDLCLFKAHELPHGNTPVRGPGRRLSIVAYARRQLCREAA